MTAAIMQPYFFPYLGYFQLMAACEVFVVADDVQYIQRGWVNRNRILVNGQPRWITLPVAQATHTLPINRRHYLLDHQLTHRIRRRIVGAYRHAPHFRATLAIVDDVLGFRDSNVARFNTNLLERVASHLRIQTPVRFASSILPDRVRVGQEAILELCACVGVSGYINPAGGGALYDPARFAARGLTLRLLRSSPRGYPQFGSAPVPSLSVIDVMMFNSLDSIRAMLGEYRLIAGNGEAEPHQEEGGGNS